MTREEAANILWWASKQHYPGEQIDITEYNIEAFDMAAVALRGPQPQPAQPEAGSPTTQHCPVCSTTLESRGGYIRVILGKPDVASGIQGASWYCAECDRVWDYGDLPSIARQLADNGCLRPSSLATVACRACRARGR